MSEKIMLRLKSNPTLVLPEANLEDTTPERYLISFPGANTTNYFPRRDWEPVPPPYVLPTGLGAVVQADHGTYVQLSPSNWYGSMSQERYNYDQILKWAENGELTTISEGVQP